MNKSINRIYMDNAATSFPKAPGVADSMYEYITNVGSNIGRGTYNESLYAEKVVFETREFICKLMNYDKPENVIFTKNITESLNILIKGMLKQGDHVIVSAMEHNAVMRPLNSLKGVEYTRVKCDKFGQINPLDVKRSIKESTKAIIMLQSSNVCGTILNLEAVGKIAKETGIFFIIDAAQTAGFLDIDFKKLSADAIAFTGHKSLLGPQGIGGFIISDRLNKCVLPLIEGGTGSASEDENQPNYLPDKFEAGTPNVVGIFGLNASLKFIIETGIDKIRDHELSITKKFIEEVENIDGVKIMGKLDIEYRTAVVSLDFEKLDNSEVAYVLDNEYGISVRVGLHCSPSAHKTLGTFPEGTVRFSFSYFNTLKEVEHVTEAIKKIVSSKK